MTGEEVKEIRLEYGLSQEEFGNTIGLSKSGVSNIESNKRKVTRRVEKAINHYFTGNDSDETENFDLSKIPTYALLAEIERRCLR